MKDSQFHMETTGSIHFDLCYQFLNLLLDIDHFHSLLWFPQRKINRIIYKNSSTPQAHHFFEVHAMYSSAAIEYLVNK